MTSAQSSGHPAKNAPVKIRRALLSVSDKTDLLELASAHAARGV